MDGAHVEPDFDDYVRARWPRLVRFACLLGCSVPEGEDVVQTALVKCLPNWKRVASDGDVDAYVHRAVINTFRTARARRWTGEVPTEFLTAHAGPAGEESADPAEAVVRRHAIAGALASLPAEQRSVVVARYYAHLDERQMSEVLGIPAGTVKSRLSRALKALAAHPDLAEAPADPVDLGGSR